MVLRALRALLRQERHRGGGNLVQNPFISQFSQIGVVKHLSVSAL
jgi:hypothetical protein